jgi:hypothetical protein
MDISRRKFLIANGAVMTLPILPSLADDRSDKAIKPSKKLAIMYVPNGLVRRCFFVGEEEKKSPGFVGGFNSEKFKHKRDKTKPGIYPLELSSTMQPLAKHKKNITLITGLDRSYQNGTDVHAQAGSCYLSSVSPGEAIERKYKYPQGRTLDHIVGDAVGRTSVFKTLEISCNGFERPKEPPHFNNISWYDNEKVAPSIKDPRKLYDRLFSADSYREHVVEVTDLMLADAKALQKKLGREDRHTMAEFMETVRGVEVRITKLQEKIKGADVKVPPSERLPRGEYIRLMTDLMLVAFQMGITNVCTMMIGPERWDATQMYEGVFDKPVQHHSMTHNQKGNGYKKVQKIDIFHIEQYSYLLSRMENLKEADGTSMLDNSIVTYGAGLGDGATHQYFNLPLILAGRAQGAIKQGRHLLCKNGLYNSNAWLSIAQHMGVEIDTFSDSSGGIAELTQA